MASLDGSTPNPDAIVAIAAAYLILIRRPAPAEAPVVPRWRLAGRFPSLDPFRVRFASERRSGWSAAGRLDG